MAGGHWIWYNGDFELYHSILLHSRRIEFGIQLPTFWALSAPYPNVNFLKHFSAPEAFTFRAHAKGTGYLTLDGRRYNIGDTVTVAPGEHDVFVNLIEVHTFPALYIDSPHLITDHTWIANHAAGKAVPCGDRPLYESETDDPAVFAFSYLPLTPVMTEKVDGGMLYDYGKETFCRITLEGADPQKEILLVYGESREEALDIKEALVFERCSGQTSYSLIPRALRYLYVVSDTPVHIRAEYEYLPLQDRASFSCNKKKVAQIYDMCAYTFHLNSREFYLDGIKRDRWVWSGDAFQSYMANSYLYFDPEITKRTIITLLGKPPYEQHINTITDYTMYLLIGAAEYYKTTGDAAFIRTYFDRFLTLYRFLAGRTDENDYVCQRDGDWIFIDWSDMDKSAPLAAEQILYWRTKYAMAELCAVCGTDGDGYIASATALKKRIMRDFWREDRGAFIDCVHPGAEHVTRHPNIFAILFDFVPERRARKILRNVLNNDNITAITTPYFAFFELCARARMGDLRTVQKKIESYWGGMLDLGATSVWEQYIPEHEGIEHYGMYGMKYGCSLCHAWGAGPIYLLGRYCLGVYPTDIGYKTFAVAPNCGMYTHMEGTVPLPGEDSVTVRMDRKEIRVLATRSGGTLLYGGKEYPLTAGEEFVLSR